MLSIAFVIGSINSSQSMKSKITQKGDNMIRPNVNDVQKLVKPLIQAPYKPIEVENLYQSQQRENNELDMQNAEILGAVASPKGLVEKPVLYDTVITPHSTSISHANQINSLTQGLNAGPGAQAMFQTETSKLAQGQVAIPVKIQSHSRVADDYNFETPVFIHKGQSDITERNEDIIKVPETPMVTPANISTTSAQDTKAIRDRLSHAATYQEKVRALKSEKERIRLQAKDLKSKIHGEVSNLLKAKHVGHKLNSIIEKYSKRLRKEQEAQNIRVNPEQLKHDIAKKLGH